jgi:hypothetical protein
MTVRIAVALALLASTAQAQEQTFRVGEAVELEASGRWVPCVVSEPGGPDRVMRVNCEAYPALSRAAGSYIVHDRTTAGIRRPGAKTPAAAKPAGKPVTAAAGPGALKIGEYACYGAGGRPMIGLGFKVLPGNRYTDLDGKNAGAFSISGGQVAFRGGHLAGQTGRELKDGRFRIGAMAGCEPW